MLQTSPSHNELCITNINIVLQTTTTRHKNQHHIANFALETPTSPCKHHIANITIAFQN
jgi:hypothetical protein